MEVLVVMLLIGLSLKVLFRLDYSAGPQRLENTAREFAGSAALALEEAVLDGTSWGIDFFTDSGQEGAVFGYRWLQFSENAWRPAQPAGMDAFQTSVLLDADYRLDLEVEGLDVQPEPRVNLGDMTPAFAPEVWLYPDHESTAFTVAFSHREYGSLSVQSDILGRFRLREPGS